MIGHEKHENTKDAKNLCKKEREAFSRANDARLKGSRSNERDK